MRSSRSFAPGGSRRDAMASRSPATAASAAIVMTAVRIVPTAGSGPRHAGEAHEGEGHDPGGHEGDGRATKRGRNIGSFQALADRGKQHQHQREELRSALVTLATAMVRCMASALAPDQVLTALALQAFEHVVPPQPVRLRLPAELVEPVRAQLATRELPMPVQCLADTELHGLDCVVESQAGALLAGLDTVLTSAAQRIETSQRQMAAPEARAA